MTTLPDGHPYREAWGRLEEDARGRGLVHGAKALDYLPRRYGPAEACDLLAKMVEAGVLKPCKLDLAGVSHSRKAFLGLQYKGVPEIFKTWGQGHADLWTYEAA